MLYFLFALSALALSAVAVWVWTFGRTAVTQIVENSRRPAHRADWTADADAPVPFGLTDDSSVTDVMFDDEATGTRHFATGQPVYGRAADRLRDELRRKAY
jgi:hypothetical protein